jgi:DNA-binding NtrC family response regulator
MPSILTVDDSTIVRTAVSRVIEGLGFEVAEAGDGVAGLATLAECRFDLVILDVQMPNMDGPTMLEKMREAGDRTPVIMLTGESQRTTIARAMKCGITDYMMKPFDPRNLRDKVISAVQSRASERILDDAPPAGAAADAAWARPSSGPRCKQMVDVMVVDDMENVRKRLRSMLPDHVTLNGFTSAQSALASAREKGYRAIFIDTEMPDVDSVVLAQRMRQLQPIAVVGALAMRTKAAEQANELREQGFGFVLYKPFTQDAVDEFLARHFDNQELLVREDNLLRFSRTVVKAEQRERYFGRLDLLFAAGLKDVACASYPEVIVDVGSVDFASVVGQSETFPKLLASGAAQASDYGMNMLVVGSDAIREALASYEETSGIACFGTLREARDAARTPPRRSAPGA